MPRFYSRRRYVRRPKRRTATTKKRKMARRVATRSYVKRAIARNVETKVATVEGQNISGSEAPTNANILNFTPQISQGTTQSTRIGDHIKVKRYSVRVTISAAGATSTQNPTLVKLVFFRAVDYMSAPTTADLAYLLQSGATSNAWNAALGGYEGMINANQSFNTEKFKIFAVRQCVLWKPSSSSHANPNSYQNGNYVISKNMRIALHKKMRKNLKFNDSVSNYPTNEGVYALVLQAQVDGQSGGPIATANIAGDLYFEDA